MKKQWLIGLLIAIVALSLNAQEQGKDNDPLKKLHKVEQIQPVDSTWKPGFDSITKEDAEAYLTFIASDLLQGRETATQSYAVASEFTATLFSSWGLKAAGDFQALPNRGMFSPQSGSDNKKRERTFFQNVPMRETIDKKSTVIFTEKSNDTVQTTKPIDGIDYKLSAPKAQNFEASIVFVGYGLNVPKASFNEFKGVDVKGKVVILLDGRPDHQKDKKRMLEIEKVIDEPSARRYRRRSSPALKNAQQAGAIGVITVSADVESWLEEIKPRPAPSDDKPIIDYPHRRVSLAVDEGMSMPWELIPNLRVSPKLADELLRHYGHTIASLKKKIDQDLTPVSFTLKDTRIHLAQEQVEKPTSCRNVLAFLEGSDPELKEELVIIGAHLDHLGQSGPYIYNGADDNGSGATVVLQLAKAFAQNKQKPKRSMLFALWTGEEMGLLGSRFYVAHPFIPLNKTRTYLNLDMTSRLWDKGTLSRMARMMQLEKVDDLIKVIDVKRFSFFTYLENTMLESALKSSNEKVGFEMMLRPTQDSMGGSDHWPFGHAKVPWIFFMAAMTDDYHQPSDEVSRCSFELMQSIGRLCYLTAVQLAE